MYKVPYNVCVSERLGGSGNETSCQLNGELTGVWGRGTCYCSQQ